MSRSLLPALSLLFVAGCVAPSNPPPAPAPTPSPAPPPVATLPPPPPPPASSDWRDWPLTHGGWRYQAVAGGSVARFGAGVASLTCDRASRTISFAVQGSGARAIVRTSSASRTLPMTPAGGSTVAARLPARDNVFDAMGFSRGRFVVEGVSARPLVIPAWPEILRVAEDCRG